MMHFRASVLQNFDLDVRQKSGKIQVFRYAQMQQPQISQLTAYALAVALLLLSALTGAIYAVLNRVLVRSFSTFEITYFMMTVGAIAFALASFVQHAAHGDFSAIFTPFADLSFTAAILYLSVFSSLLTTIFMSIALTRLTSAGLTIFLNLSTVVAILVGYLWLGETVHAFHLIGAAMILAGVIGTNGFASPESKKA